MKADRLAETAERRIKAIERCRQELDDHYVNKPKHYMIAGIEVRDISRELCSSLKGLDAADYKDAIKYLLRAPNKDRFLQDLKKCRFHVNALIESLEAEDDKAIE